MKNSLPEDQGYSNLIIYKDIVDRECCLTAIAESFTQQGMAQAGVADGKRV